MSNPIKNIVLTKHFEDDVKFYRNKKKYRKIDNDITPIVQKLEQGNLIGDRLSGLDLPEGAAAYKVRIANSSTGSGKSNGFRMLYYAAIGDEIYLLAIYSKKDDERVPNDRQVELIIRNV